MKTKEITRDKGRLFVTPDLHGCYDKLMEKLDEVDFDYDCDLLIGLGDLVDRGKKSLDCFNLTYKSWFESVVGNHEDFCLQYVLAKDESQKNHIKSTHLSNGGEWFYKLPESVQKEIAKKIESLPVTITVNRNAKRYGFVHGDIPAFVKDWDDLNEFLNFENSDSTVSQCIWGRSMAKRALKASRVLEGPLAPPIIGKVDHIYLGHTVIQRPITYGNMTFLDTGAVFDNVSTFGRLSLMEIL